MELEDFVGYSENVPKTFSVKRIEDDYLVAYKQINEHVKIRCLVTKYSFAFTFEGDDLKVKEFCENL